MHQKHRALQSLAWVCSLAASTLALSCSAGSAGGSDDSELDPPGDAAGSDGRSGSSAPVGGSGASDSGTAGSAPMDRDASPTAVDRPDGGNAPDGALDAGGGDPLAGSDARVRGCGIEDPAGYILDPEVPGVVQGSNGTFADACDDDGNLIEYLCESRLLCGPGPNPACNSMNTGLVISELIDCSGHCSGAACAARCPNFGDRLVYRSFDPANGAATLENQTDQRSYECELSDDTADDGYDCLTAPTVGSEVKMVTQGLQTSQCTGGGFGTIGVTDLSASDQDWHRCAYACAIP
jgi:hypothetical protein